MGFTPAPNAFVSVEDTLIIVFKRTFSCNRVSTETRPVIFSLSLPISWPKELLYPKDTLYVIVSLPPRKLKLWLWLTAERVNKSNQSVFTVSKKAFRFANSSLVISPAIYICIAPSYVYGSANGSLLYLIPALKTS